MNRLRHSIIAFLCCLPMLASAESDPLEAFPQAAKGQQRHVIELPKLGKEEDFKVELIAGQTQEVDCNQRFMGGALKEKTLDGWGYNYFVLDEIGPTLTTLIACPDESVRSTFVSLGGEPLLVRYNSKLPLVLYTPDGIEVFYRIWSASDERLPASVR